VIIEGLMAQKQPQLNQQLRQIAKYRQLQEELYTRKEQMEELLLR